MHFRVATPADAAELAALRWTWRTDEDANREIAEPRETAEPRDLFMERFVAFARDALTGRWTVWVAEDETRIVSNIWIYRVPKVPSPGRQTREFGYMTNVYTVPDQRNAGIGSELLAAVRAWAHQEDLEMVIVWPSEQSVPWYSRGGFSPSGEMLELEVAGYEG